ncbi:MAG TPA: PEP-CTERM sorting domain-containing protein [Methylomirabilota bacterium]|jgi:hypothetical protein
MVLETAGATVVSDVIRFNPAGTGSPGYPASLVFYSDNADGADALADTGFPTGSYTNTVTVTEVGIEGTNGVTYHPVSGQPGFVAGFDVTYVIQSDTAAVPEPASVLLVAIGGGLLVATRRWPKALGS